MNIFCISWLLILICCRKKIIVWYSGFGFLRECVFFVCFVIFVINLNLLVFLKNFVVFMVICGLIMGWFLLRVWKIGLFFVMS